MTKRHRVPPRLVSLEPRRVPTTFAVTNLNDAGSGSLRQAISNANSSPGADSVVFDATLFLTQKTIALTSGLSVTDDIAIVGPAAGVVIDRGGVSTNGTVIGFSGIATDVWTVSRIVVTGGNSKNSGGGIELTTGGTLTLTECVIAGNTADAFGGGIVILNSGTSQTAVTLDNCTIADNAARLGGGILSSGDNVNITLRNCTLTGNSAGFGGGLYFSGGGKALIANSTVSGNKATSIDFNGNDDGAGGGVFVASTTPALIIRSSVVSGNAAAFGSDIRQSVSFVRLDHCAVGTSIGFDPFDEGGNLPYGINPLLGTLGSHGGLGKTFLPAAESPLLNAGANPAALATDQRGQPRVVGVAPDIGAVERSDLIVRNTNDSGNGSLRLILMETDLMPGADTVTFDPVAFNTPQVIALTSGLLGIGGTVTVRGPAARPTIDGNGAPAVVVTTGAPAGSVIVLENLSITDGKSGIQADDETLILVDCVVTGNTLIGGVSVFGGYGSLTLRRSAVTNNAGGGVRMFGYVYSPSLTVVDTTISGNTASGPGGGIYTQYAADVVIQNSTISGNQASQGGGVRTGGQASTRTFTMINSTVSGNSAATAGGGLAFVNANSTLSLFNSTITANSAGTGAGGGIAVLSGGGSLSLTSSIVSGNANATAPDISRSGGVTANFSAIGSPQGFTLSGGDNLAFGVDLKLGSLAGYGGLTFTHALLPGSPAIGAGSNPGQLTTDQRGLGFARAIGIADIGAYENQSVPAKVTQLAINDGSAQRSRVTSLKVAFDQNVGSPPASAFQLLNQKTALAPTITAVADNSGPTTVVTLTFTGSSVEATSLADGRYTLTITAGAINGGAFDGDGNGIIGDDYALVGTPANGLFRLFGDADGSGQVNSADFLAFRLAYLSSSPTFDVDGSGQVNAADFLRFRLNYFQSV